MKKLFSILLVLPSIFMAAQKSADPASTFAKSITADDLKKNLYIVASKEMEGRETATPGQKRAAAYIESQFKALGLKPGNNGSYQFTYPVLQDSLTSTSITVNNKAFELDKDFSVNIAQNQTFNKSFSEVVFVGNGTVDSTHDDYKGLDVRGKVVLMLGSQGGQGMGRAAFAQQMAKIVAAQKNGAAAVLVTGGNFPRPTKTNPKGNMYLGGATATIPEQFSISENVARAIMGDDYDKVKAGTVEAKTYKANVALNFDKKQSNLES